ncbi:YceI family protein [Erythrobacter dokdonensis]|uniref:YceI family protein n=1 Tax=Erythrobacter dokdonensis DSW-74 TaxID=1300349 RepID=A0A1A7BEP1_9SPHN|nr:YceI family protein [Erythrobacter dokdonensis]OBV11008.1 YceI family protein [Erythrobacter dokdonensis DSW-74]
MTNLRPFAPFAAALALGLGACAQPAAEGTAADQASSVTEGAWTLDPVTSRLSYVSIKAGEIAESNGFEKLSGSVAADGTASIEIDLASVATGVDIRNERMRDIFFQVADNPTAVVAAKLDPAAFAGLAVGQSLTRPLKATLTIKGVEQEIETEVLVTRAAETRVTVVPTAPVIITTDMFDLTDELGELRALAQLPSITPAVPVTFTLAFTRTQQQ